MNYTLEKSTVQVYKIKMKNGAFAHITLDEYERSGRISISSDFGNWSHFFGSCGKSFKEFLTGLDIGYTAGKFGENRWFDQPATIKELRKLAKENAVDKQHKLDLKGEIDDLEECVDHGQFVACMWVSNEVIKLCDGAPNIVTDISPGFKSFWNNAWAAFVAELKNELKIQQL